MRTKNAGDELLYLHTFYKDPPEGGSENESCVILMKTLSGSPDKFRDQVRKTKDERILKCDKNSRLIIEIHSRNYITWKFKST